MTLDEQITDLKARYDASTPGSPERRHLRRALQRARYEQHERDTLHGRVRDTLEKRISWRTGKQRERLDDVAREIVDLVGSRP